VPITPGDHSSKASINDFNRWMREQPWYQQFFAQRGLDPNHVKLSKGQRQQLEQVALRQGGLPPKAFDDMMIDPAGNLNTEHGFASQPTWLKVLEIGAAGTAAAFGGAAALGGLSGSGGAGGAGAAGATAGGSGAAASSLPVLASTAYGGAAAAGPTIAGASTIGGVVGGLGAGTAAAAGLPTLASTAYPGAASAGPSITGASTVGGTVGAAGIPTLASTQYPGAASAGPSIDGATTLANGVTQGVDWGGLVNKGIDAATSAIPAIQGLTDKKAPGSSPEAQALIDAQRARMEQANPLYESVLRLAMNRLPDRASAGLSVPSYADANASVPQTSAGDYLEDPATRNLMRTQLIRAKMSDPVQQAMLRLAQSRMPTSVGGY